MMSTAKPLTHNKSLPNKELNTPQKQKLVARWKTVEGKLICQWVSQEKRHNNTR